MQSSTRASLVSRTSTRRRDRSLPSAVAELRSLIHAADAMIFWTPEYAGAMPGSWFVQEPLGLDRRGRPPRSIHEKPVAWINTSPRGAVNAHDSLRKVLGYASATVTLQASWRNEAG